MKLYLDPGHGGHDPGATGNGLLEKNIVLDIALRIQTILNNNYNNVEVKMSRTTDTFVSLDQRTNEANAWDADYFLSIHCNAYNGSADGYEDYIYVGLSNSSVTAKYQDIIHNEVTSVNQLDDRGQKQANFHVLRESAMPALITENGFIDNDHDAALLNDPSWRQTVARGHVNGLERAFNLERKQASGKLYRVIAGSFKDRNNAKDRVQYLDSKGIQSFVNPIYISDDLWYRVQAGAFEKRQNAENRLTAVKKAGIKKAFISVEQTDTVNNNSGKSSGYAILGAVQLSPEQMNRYARKVNPDAPLLGQFYLNFGTQYGIRGDIAFAQALHETDYFRFTGSVKAKQNNYAGIGATGPDQPGASFETPRQGVLAHIQHLFAYATSESLPNIHDLVDPRFNLVDRGKAPTWQSLNGKWAVPGDNYGQSVLDLYSKMINNSMTDLESILADIKE
ncbi:N-acetylmuramoyl-L-alanine amidase [Tuberibacillus sp. Marseille-P3662]|uniref:N-acetylmuramoyl-L-alanine amidase n=1 Tax=Tuberibacillus sp. Marseille-P3662 TaxID=1965358 RepID=UPI000A1C7D58|nr:N-acetylmuramoyl-L-alanine amidase [Tuberibacillus sp. Marseille-P3662]